MASDVSAENDLGTSDGTFIADSLSDKMGQKSLEIAEKIRALGIRGLGPYKSAAAIAEEALAGQSDVDEAIQRVIAIHRRWVASSGFATGFGGVVTMAVSLPADITVFYALCARMSAAIAILRGYDIESEEVQSAVLLTLLGAGAAGAVGKTGASIGKKMTVTALRRLPGRHLTAVNQRVGFRLLTKFGQKGSINLVRGVPLVGGGVGAGVNVVTLNGIARYAKKTFN